MIQRWETKRIDRIDSEDTGNLEPYWMFDMRKKKEWPLDQKKKYELYHTHMRIGAVQKQDLVMDIAVHMPQQSSQKKRVVMVEIDGEDVCMIIEVSGTTASRISKSQKISKKISYEPHRNFIQSQTSKNLLRKWSRFCKNIL